MSIESDANQDLSMSDEDADGIVGGKAHHKTEKPTHQVTPAESNVEVQASGGGWQPVVDDPSEDC